MSLDKLKLPEDEFLILLESTIALASKLQNNPPDLVPQEELVCDLVIEYLRPYTTPNGPLTVRKVGYVPNRANLIITYPGSDATKVVSFVGCHMDVVPANAEQWERPPFKLTRDGDKMYGRGVTDCLGHVCLLATFFKQLAINKPALKRSVIGVFIANEENSSAAGVGIDELEKRGELEKLKNGPLYWIDSANFGPTLGTGGVATWQLVVTGKQFHSGFPHNGINSVELAHRCVDYIQRRFYADFNKFEAEEKKYLFLIGSSLKPTQIATPPGSLNQIPGVCTVSGDIRFTPFYSIDDVKTKMELYVKDLQAEIPKFEGHGVSKYHLAEEKLTGKAELKWLDHPYKGVAVKLDSPGYKALHDAIAKAKGQANPFALTGSLPIIRDLQDSGFDVQITGFGTMAAYHAHNEYGMLSDFHKGFTVCSEVVATLDKQ